MSTTAGWDGLLAEGEEIVWQGQPAGGIVWGDLLQPIGLMGLIFTGFSIFWIGAAASITGSGPGGIWMLFPLFGVPFLLIGLYMLVGRVVLDAYLRANTWYTLTDRTAFIAVEAFGRKRLDSYPLRDMDLLRLEDGIPGCIIFGESDGRGTRSAPVKVGFRRVAYARELFGQMRQLREAQSTQRGETR